MTLTTLSLLLSSQEARDAAPCVVVTGPWYLKRGGVLSVAFTDNLGEHFLQTGIYNARLGHLHFYDCIWSGDLPALLAAMVAENEGLKQALMQIDALDPEWQGIESISSDAAFFQKVDGGAIPTSGLD
jgi:hypothetical protein